MLDMSAGKAGRVVAPLVLTVLLAVSGCSEKGGGTRYPNTPPDTHISAGPSEVLPNHYRVSVFWFGTDVDGDVDHYDISVLKGVRRGEPIELDSLYWHSTRANDSTFVVAADSCCYGDPGADDPHYAVSYWGILVRAVDNEQGVDETPASVFFVASNELPRVDILAPPHMQPSQTLCTLPYFEWVGTDPDGDRNALQYKYLAVPSTMRRDLWGNGLPPYEYEGAGEGNAAPEIGRWSFWVPADCTYVEDIDLSEYREGSEGADSIGFYVAVKDEGEAFLPVELYRTYNQGGNMRTFTVRTQDCALPAVIESDKLGIVRTYVCTGRPADPPVIFSGTALYMSFYAEERRQLGQMAGAYRYYLDEPGSPMSSWPAWTPVAPLRERGAEPEWRVILPAAGPGLTPDVGQHLLRVELENLARDTACAEFHFDVLEGPAGRESNILLVDDNLSMWWGGSPPPDYENEEFEMWSDILQGYDWQEWDTGSDFGVAVPAHLVGNATTVIWSVDEGRELAPDLLDLCSRRGNYLHSYVEAGGNLIIIGMSPVYSTMYWFDGTPDPADRQTITSMEFSPRVLDESHAFEHFMWDVFGIAEMRISVGPSTDHITGMEPCEGYDEWNAVPAREKGEVEGWPGYFAGAFLAVEVRPGEDVHPFYGILSLKNPADPDTSWIETPDCDKLAAVYVEGDGVRGGAAFICLPAWWLDHDEVGEMIRRLLDVFGE